MTYQISVPGGRIIVVDADKASRTQNLKTINAVIEQSGKKIFSVRQFDESGDALDDVGRELYNVPVAIVLSAAEKDAQPQQNSDHCLKPADFIARLRNGEERKAPRQPGDKPGDSEMRRTARGHQVRQILVEQRKSTPVFVLGTENEIGKVKEALQEKAALLPGGDEKNVPTIPDLHFYDTGSTQHLKKFQGELGEILTQAAQDRPWSEGFQGKKSRPPEVMV